METVMRYGYARDTALEQGLGAQLELLAGEGIGRDRVFIDAIDAGEDSRPGYDALMSQLQPGDAVVVTSFARIVRSSAKLLALSEQLERRGVGLVSLKEQIDTTTPAGRYFFAAARAFGDVQRSITREIQAEGIASAKADGVAFGHGRVDPAKLERALSLHAEGGKTLAQIAAESGVSVSTILRALKSRRGQ